MADDTTLTINLETILKGLDKTVRGLGQVEKSLKTVANVKPRDTQRSLKDTSAAAKNLADTQQRLINRQKNLEASTLRASAALDRARLATQRVDAAKSRFARTTLPNLDKQLQKTARTLNSIGGGLKSLGTSLTVGLTAPLTALGVLSTRNAVALDSLKRGLAAITGSAADAATQLERLREIAKAPGIGFQEAIQGSIRLQAVGFAARDAEKELRLFANAVALTGGGRDELERVTVQLGQLAAKGKVVAQDLKPIIEAAPAVGQALLKAFGTVNSEDIQKLGLSTEEFFDRLNGALEDLPKAAVGAQNAFENFSDSVFIASSAIGEAILPPLTRIINLIEPIILDLAESFKSLSPEIQTVVVAVAALAAAAGPVLFVLGGIVTGIGTLITAITAIGGVIGTIGFPALAAILAALVVDITALATAAVVLFKAWQTNFLGIRDIVANASRAVLKAFGDIKGVFNEATQRILPTLESITNKVVTAVSRIWDRYGSTVVKVVGDAFRFIIGVTTTFLRQFADFVDLVLKLIDSDWKGAWQAFSRIVVNAVEGISKGLLRLSLLVVNALHNLVQLLLAQAARFVLAAQELGRKFIVALGIQIVAGAPVIRNALLDMLLIAAAGIVTTGVAGILVDRLFADMKKAAAQQPAARPAIGGSGVDLSLSPGLTRQRRPRSGTAAGGGGDKSGLSKIADLQDKLAQQQDELTTTEADNRLNLIRASVEQQFALTKDGLDRELALLQANFEDRLVAAKKYFDERRRLQEAEIDAEIAHEKALSGALFDEFSNRTKEIEREFNSSVEDINRDPKLKSRAKTLALQTAEQKKQTDLAKAQTDFETQNADVSTRILILQKQRKQATADTNREEKNLTEELQKQQQQLQIDLAEERGDITEAAAGRLSAQFREALKELRVDLASLSPELQNAINNVDLSELKSRLDELPEPVRILINLLEIGIQKARIAEQVVDVDRTLAELRLQEIAIQNKVLDGVLTEREARREILGIQGITRDRLLDILAAQLAIAKSTAGQEDEVLRIQAQIQEVQRLGKVVDEVGQQINRELLGDIRQGIEGIFSGARKGFEGLKQAAIDFGNSLLDTLNRIAADSIVQKLEGIFKPDSQDTKGTPGGFLAKLFGLTSKDAPPVVANTAATEANTEAINSLTTVFGGQAALPLAGAGTGGAAQPEGSAIKTVQGILGGIIPSLGGDDSSTPVGGGSVIGALTSAVDALKKLTESVNRLIEVLGGTAPTGATVSGLFSSLFSGSFGGAATGMFPAVPGGVVRIVEGGFPEAVLTTDPKHANRQAQILKAYLTKTKGLFGRIKGFETGGFLSARDAEMNFMNSIQRNPSALSNVPAVSLAGRGSDGMSVRVINQLTSKTATRPYINSEEGVRDILNIISANADDIGRRIGVK